jgi:hypothetical protein
MRLTHDWRVKQVVLVDAPAFSGWYSHDRNTELRKHCKPVLIEDMKENIKEVVAEKANDTENAVKEAVEDALEAEGKEKK